MSRVASNPIELPKSVELKLEGSQISVKGPKGQMTQRLHASVKLMEQDGAYFFEAADESGKALAGTMRALVANMVQGVANGFERKLNLVGVGYRAQAQGNRINLQLGFSHPVDFELPEGVTAETPSQTEIVVRGIDKQKVGQVAAKIRAYRPPEPYKGKGVRYSDERVVMKEAKKA